MFHRLTLFIVFFFTVFYGFSQTERVATLPSVIQPDFRSTMREQMEFYRQFSYESEEEWDRFRSDNGIDAARQQQPAASYAPQACDLSKRVFGWFPYWQGSTYNNFNWSMLTDLSFFGYEVDAATGNAVSTHGWSTANVVTVAQANNVRVTLTATLFSGHATFLSSSTAQQTLITNLISLCQARNAKGVNIDFEGLPLSQKANFTAFMINLCNQMHTAIAGSEVSIAIYSVDWNGVFDIAALNSYVDLFIIMGYDYYYSGSSTAGPNDPLYNFNPPNYNYTLTKSITYYLSKGMTPSKLLLGVPYYGREWTTTTNTIPSSTMGSSNSILYSTYRNNTNGYYNTRNWDGTSYTPWFAYQKTAGQWWQLFIDDAYAMGKRFDMVNQRGIGGIGIWALGYDDGYQDFWNLIRDRFSTCAIHPCTDTLFDMGGPNTSYYDKENYTYTIQPDNATAVSVNFTDFNLETGYDSLWLYNGTSTASPLIGGYTGTVGPGTVTGNTGALTLRFKSDNATVTSGFRALVSCVMDNVPPVTSIQSSTGWKTTNYPVNFTDTDLGSGVEKSFYQVTDFTGTDWYANTARGFMNDDFTAAAISPQWTTAGGTWAINTGVLTQSDETNANTNIYASLTQNLSNRYLYHWKAKMDGSGTNRRCGLHFCVNNPTQPNRGTNYLVWFRADQDRIEIYRNSGDTLYIKQTLSPVVLNPNQWYDFKISYDRISGVIKVYVDNVYVGSWTDPSPLTGSYVSLRNGNSQYRIDDFRVYRSRNASVTVTVGTAADDVRYQNPNPSTPSAKVRSIITDNAHYLSAISEQSYSIDWTAPSTPAYVNDTTNTIDIDETFSLTTLSGSWGSSTDTHSGITSYYYAIGTTPGGTNIVPWTANGLVSQFTQSGLNLQLDQPYYISVYSVNGAGLSSAVLTSDGITPRGCGKDTYEPNNSVVDAAVLYSGTYGNSRICPMGDIDWYSIYLQPNTPHLRVKLAQLGANFDVFIYDPTVTLIASSFNAGTVEENVSLFNLPTGTYYIKVMGATPDQVSGGLGYQLSYTAYNVVAGGTKTPIGANNGISSLLRMSTWQLYPNPAQDKVVLSGVQETEVPLSVYLRDYTGKLVDSYTYPLPSGTFSQEISLENLPNGFYWLEAKTPTVQEVYKLQVVKE